MNTQVTQKLPQNAGSTLSHSRKKSIRAPGVGPLPKKKTPPIISYNMDVVKIKEKMEEKKLRTTHKSMQRLIDEGDKSKEKIINTTSDSDKKHIKGSSRIEQKDNWDDFDEELDLSEPSFDHNCPQPFPIQYMHSRSSSRGNLRKDIPLEHMKLLTPRAVPSKFITTPHHPSSEAKASWAEPLHSRACALGPSDFLALRLLGRGSFGEVFLVQYDQTQELYAMKVLDKAKIEHLNLVKYVLTERKVLSNVRHPFIVRLHYAFQTDSKLYLVLDYCAGGDLGHCIEREKRLSEARAKIYIAEILLALEYLHTKDIIFRDLKPDNIVLDSEGHALLTDFGLSKEGIYDNRGAKSFCGSMAYLAPEMIKRTGHGKSVDWYLLGVVLYEMLVGIPPYYSPNQDELFLNIQKGILKIPSSMSDQARELILGLLNRNPNKRMGAGPTDSEEIKAHPWFVDINWTEVYSRKLRPPKPTVRKVEGKLPEEIEPSGTTVGSSKIEGWTFIEMETKDGTF